MGWTGVKINYSQKRIKEEILSVFENYEIIKVESVQEKSLPEGTFYIAAKREEVVRAWVAIWEYKGGELAYKIMSEAEGPYYYGATLSFIGLLTDEVCEDSLAWRAKVIANNAGDPDDKEYTRSQKILAEQKFESAVKEAQACRNKMGLVACPVCEKYKTCSIQDQVEKNLAIKRGKVYIKNR